MDKQEKHENLDAWVAEHLDRPETIWQAFRDWKEPETPAGDAPGEADAEDAEAELAALLGYAEQMNARSVFEGMDPGFPPPPPFGTDGAFPLAQDWSESDGEDVE